MPPKLRARSLGKKSASRILLALFFLAAGTYAARTFFVRDTYRNPVLSETYYLPSKGVLGIGDPTVILHGGKYFLYPTGDNHSYYVYISTDLVHWKKGPRVFSSAEGGVWAPDVFYNPPDKKFYLSYTVNRKVGVAVSDTPDGVFSDRGVLIPNAIDANMFRDDDGRYYLYYAEFPVFKICVQPMKDPLHKEGEAHELFRPTEPWEMKQRPVTEAPWLMKHNNTYYLLYSGGDADTEDYAIGYATAKSPLGPFVKYPGNPIMKKGNGVFGPGHCAVTRTPDGKMWIVYHQKRTASKGWDRIICLDRLWFDNKGILHGKATRSTPQPVPFTGIGKILNQRRLN